MPTTGPGAPRGAPPTQPPLPGMAPARWLYVDAKRTHEVVAGVREGAPPRFVVKESAFGNTEPDEVHEWSVAVAEPWEAQLRHAELEKRLALLGEYWRHDAQQQPGVWTRVRAPAFASVDLRPVRAAPFDGRVLFHHAWRAGAPDVVLVAIHEPATMGARYLLASARFAFPDAEGGEVEIIERRMPHAPALSILARELLALEERGYRKLVGSSDFERSHGARWQDEAGRAYDAILRRLSEGRLGAPSASKRDAPQDELYTDYLRNLSDPRLLALHARYLGAEEERAALAGGEAAIRQLIARKRAAAKERDEGILLTILEASLLARHGLASASPHVDPEVAALVRRFAHYL